MPFLACFCIAAEAPGLTAHLAWFQLRWLQGCPSMPAFDCFAKPGLESPDVVRLLSCSFCLVQRSWPATSQLTPPSHDRTLVTPQSRHVLLLCTTSEPRAICHDQMFRFANHAEAAIRWFVMPSLGMAALVSCPHMTLHISQPFQGNIGSLATACNFRT